VEVDVSAPPDTTRFGIRGDVLVKSV
jgi:hypothetical protein